MRFLRILKLLFVGIAGLVAVVLIGGFVYQEVSESRDMKRYPPPGEMVDVDGHLMHIHCIGDGNPTLLLEPGAGSSSFSWYDIHKQLATITRTCAYDRVGLGYSDPGDMPRRATDVAQRLHKLLRSAGIDGELLLLGWSAGGIYVREYYRLYPERVAGMVLVDSSHEQQASRLPKGSGGGADPALKVARHLAPFGLVRLSGVLEQRVSSSSGSDEAKAYLSVTYHLSHALDAVAEESDAFDLDIDAAHPPRAMADLPLTVLVAGKDKDEARMQLKKELAVLSTNSELIVADDSGHHMHVDQPQLIIEAVKALLREI